MSGLCRSIPAKSSTMRSRFHCSVSAVPSMLSPDAIAIISSDAQMQKVTPTSIISEYTSRKSATTAVAQPRPAAAAADRTSIAAPATMAPAATTAVLSA